MRYDRIYAPASSLYSVHAKNKISWADGLLRAVNLLQL